MRRCQMSSRPGMPPGGPTVPRVEHGHHSPAETATADPYPCPCPNCCADEPENIQANTGQPQHSLQSERRFHYFMSKFISRVSRLPVFLVRVCVSFGGEEESDGAGVGVVHWGWKRRRSCREVLQTMPGFAWSEP